MDKVPNPARYSIADDDKLTDVVVGLVAALLAHHGLPPVFSELDLQRLRDALSVFLYGPHTPTWYPGAPAALEATSRRPGPRGQLSALVTVSAMATTSPPPGGGRDGYDQRGSHHIG